MGLLIDRDSFSSQDFRRYNSRLNQNLKALQKMMAQPGFGQFNGGRKIGAELEIYIIDDEGRPAFFNGEIHDELKDPQLTLELNRFNLEYNLKPVALRSKPFSNMAKEIRGALTRIDRVAQKYNSSTLPIGILPTAREADFGYHAMTDIARYRALTNGLRDLRGGPFHIEIEGKDFLKLDMQDVTLEGANTSLQVHLQVLPEEFADYYNALQLITPLAVAISANSRFVFGHRLWHETRIPLFKQSIDCRRYDPLRPQPARVNYGHSWVRESAFELFSEAVRLYEPLLPICGDEDPLACVSAGGTPQLEELRLQQGSVWFWNRPVYDAAEGGHLRIEARALPAGPTVSDMNANIVLLLGLMELFRRDIRVLLPAMPFEYCVRNFHSAAQLGLDAELIWPNARQTRPEYVTCRELLEQLLEKLPDGLDALGIAESEYKSALAILGARLSSGQTGAVWQLEAYEHLRRNCDREQAISQMVRLYQQNSRGGRPVHEWSVA